MGIDMTIDKKSNQKEREDIASQIIRIVEDDIKLTDYLYPGLRYKLADIELENWNEKMTRTARIKKFMIDTFGE